MLALTDRLNRDQVTRALHSLGDKYPAGLDWLDKRLDDVAADRAKIFQLKAGENLAALAIETPKGHHASKLSTFLVLPSFRHRGVGTHLLNALKRSWIDRDVDDVHVTVNYDDLLTRAFFVNNGFAELPSVFVNYGNDRKDSVLVWNMHGPLLIDPNRD